MEIDVFDGYEVMVGRKAYRFTANQATNFTLEGGIVRVLNSGRLVMAFNKWDSFRVVYAVATT